MYTDICQNCGVETKEVYDLDGNGEHLYCEECYIQWLAKQKKLVKE